MKTIIALIVTLFPASVFAASGGVDVAGNMGMLFTVVMWVAQIIGLFVLGSGIYSIYTWAKTNGQGQSIAGVIMSILVGTLMVSLGWFYNLIKASFVGDNDEGVSFTSGGQFHLALDQAAASAANSVNSGGFGRFIPEHTLMTILAFVFLVGLIAFISGLMGVKDIPDNKNSQHPVMGPIVKILGGVICMNITWFGCLVANIFGIAAICAG